MELNRIFIFISFIISTCADLLIIIAIFFLFHKIFTTKTITCENNREIFEHDKMLVDLQEEVREGARFF